MRLLDNKLKLDAIVMCSGGVDSIAGAHILLKKYGIHKLYYFNHKTPQADAMQQAVQAFADKFGMELIVRVADKEYKSEEEFRIARFKFIEESTNETFVACHHLNDAVESYLQRCFTGCPEYLPIPLETQFGSNVLLHPFLLVEKIRLQTHARVNDLNQYVVEDVTNFDPNYSRRAWLRNELIPILNEKKLGLTKIVRKRILEKLNEG